MASVFWGHPLRVLTLGDCGVALVGREARSPHESVAEARAPTEFYCGIAITQGDLCNCGVVGYKSEGTRNLGDFTFWLQTLSITGHKRLLIYLFFFFFSKLF